MNIFFKLTISIHLCRRTTKPSLISFSLDVPFITPVRARQALYRAHVCDEKIKGTLMQI